LLGLLELLCQAVDAALKASRLLLCRCQLLVAAVQGLLQLLNCRLRRSEVSR
jgi:hypothetical protein